VTWNHKNEWTTEDEEALNIVAGEYHCTECEQKLKAQQRVAFKRAARLKEKEHGDTHRGQGSLPG
jgi:hypothetical protein